MFSEDAEEWQISDLRKIVTFLALSALSDSEVSIAFMEKCMDKFGQEKVKEFMEI